MVGPTTAPPGEVARPVATCRFPCATVDAGLRGAPCDAVRSDATLEPIGLPDAPSDIARMDVPVGSLVAVEIPVTVEPIVGFGLPNPGVRTGGYASVEGVGADRVPRIEAQWTERNGGWS